MTSPTSYDCPLGIPSETLSAWRDTLLDQREAARLSAHVYDCPACRERLAAFDHLGATLRSSPAPDLREPVWSGLRARILRGGRGKAGGRALWGGGLATVAALLLVALFLALFSGHTHRTSPGSSTATVHTTPAISPTASATHTPTATPNTSGAGWSAAYTTTSGGLVGYVLAVAPTNPQIAYLCTGNPNGVTAVFASSDGGQSYQPAGSLPHPGQCSPSVDPTNARDLVVTVQSSSSTTDLYRSQDGGLTWQPQNLGGLSVMGLGWQGGALWATAAAEDSGGPGLTELWVSRNGGPMTEVDQNGSVSNGISLTDLGHTALITGHDATVYIVFGQTTVQPIGSTTIRSTDNGATWSRMKFTDGGQAIDVVTASPDAKTLVGVYEGQNGQVVISHDDGATWHKQPTPPAGVSAFNNIWVTPDGSLVALSSQYGMAQSTDNNVYELPVGASSWSVALSMPQSLFAITVSWDTSGRPAALWAIGTLGTANGLFRHALGG